MTDTILQTVLTLVPTSIMTLLVWYYQRKVAKREEARDKAQQEFSEMLLLIVEGHTLTLDGIDVVGDCVKYGKTNGELTEVQSNNKEYKNKLNSFMNKTAVQHIRK